MPIGAKRQSHSGRRRVNLDLKPPQVTPSETAATKGRLGVSINQIAGLRVS